jgi:hydrogenase maturation protease
MSLVVGLGSSHGDDRLGWAAIDALRPRLPAGTSARKASGGLELLECLEGQDEVIILDASTPGGQPGSIRVFDWPSSDIVASAPSNTHDLGLVDALRLADALGRLPSRVRIIAIEAQDMSPSESLSTSAARGLASAIENTLLEFGQDLMGTRS